MQERLIPDRPLRVLVLSPVATPSLRLLATAPLAHLASLGCAEHRFRVPYDVAGEDLVWADVVLGVRSATPLERRLLREVARLGRTTLVAWDDDLLHVPPDSICHPYYMAPRVQQAMRDILALADLVLTTTETLAQACRPCRGAAPMALAPVPALLLDCPPQEPVPRPAETVTIGFAGGLDGASYLDRLLRDALLRLKQTYGTRVRFEFFGACPSYAKALDAVHLPFDDDYEQYGATLLSRRWDIGLAPLFDTPFHRCKFYNKFLEYGAAEIAGVYSEIPPYTEIVEHERNGLLVAGETEAWETALRRLIEDPALRHRLAKQARQTLLARHTLEAVCAAWIELLAQVCSQPAVPIGSTQVRWRLRTRSRLLRRVFNFADTYGWATPYRALLWIGWKAGLRRPG